MITEIQINDVAGPIVVNAGFVIIAERDTCDEFTQVVIGVRPNLCEYVTWIRLRDVEFYHGHYYNNLEAAVKDWKIRS